MSTAAAERAPTLHFLGAARTVTGSRYLLELRRERVLVDAGLFQGYRELRDLNWQDPPFDPRAIDRLLLTHAHIDHVGAIPRLVRLGFKGAVHATPPTIELARLLLLDAAKLQEEDADFANRKGYSKHRPALPLFDEADAKRALQLFVPLPYGRWLPLPGVRARFHGSGHILGSASLELRLERPDGGDEQRLVFSGDVGRYDMALHVDPEPCPPCDILICESTYGSRDHDDPETVERNLAALVGAALRRGGIVLIPAFAVGRAQQLVLMLRQQMEAGRLPDVPIHLDSPMAIDATEIYGRNLHPRHLDPEVFEDGRDRLFPERVSLHRSVAQSKSLNDQPGPRVIVSASGMLAGGRVLHHLARLAGGRNNLILLAGYQAAGTRGRDLLDGAPTVRVHGQEVAVRAERAALHGLSAHAGRSELLRWIGAGGARPQRIYLTHGEPEALFSFCAHLREQLGCAVDVPEMGDRVDL